FAGTAWIEEAWIETPPFLAILKSFELFWLGGQAGVPRFQMYIFDEVQFPAVLRWLGLGLLLLLGLWVALPWKDQAMRIPHLRQHKGWLLTQLGLPLVILWLVSFVKPLYLAGRYDLIVFPAFILLIGLSFSKLQTIGPGGQVVAGLVAVAYVLVAGT